LGNDPSRRKPSCLDLSFDRFNPEARDQAGHHLATPCVVIALRPSSLRPLRRCGATPDVLWDAKRLLVRRSQTLGDEVRNTTKQRVRYAIELPDEVLAVLRWHVDTQLETEAPRESELLFPSIEGGFRAGTVLGKPFAAVSEEMGLGFVFTPRGMRRTFNDLARAAEVKDVVTRSISGHTTEAMQRHYSTVRGEEQRQGIARTGPSAVPSGTSAGTRRASGGTRSRKAG
jgi:integrase